MSGCVSIDGVDDVADFRENNLALKSIGLSDEERAVMWGMVAAILLLGNVDFGEGGQAALKDPTVVTKIEKLLGVSGMPALLLNRTIKIGADVTRIEHDPKQAAASTV